MNVALWIVQGALAARLRRGGVVKATRPRKRLYDEGLTWVEDFSEPAVKAIAGLEVLAAIGLILPAVTGIAPVLTPLAAVGLGLLMVGAAIVHFRRGESRLHRCHRWPVCRRRFRRLGPVRALCVLIHPEERRKVMRMLLRVEMGLGATNELNRTGEADELNRQLMDTTKPEAAYFGTANGRRTGFLVFDMVDSAQIPVIAEPSVPADGGDRGVHPGDERRRTAAGPCRSGRRLTGIGGRGRTYDLNPHGDEPWGFRSVQRDGRPDSGREESLDSTAGPMLDCPSAAEGGDGGVPGERGRRRPRPEVDRRPPVRAPQRVGPRPAVRRGRERLPGPAHLGRVLRMAPRPHRGRERRHEGPVRVRLRRFPARPPDGDHRLPLPRRGVGSQGDRARRARAPPAARRDPIPDGGPAGIADVPPTVRAGAAP